MHQSYETNALGRHYLSDFRLLFFKREILICNPEGLDGIGNVVHPRGFFGDKTADDAGPFVVQVELEEKGVELLDRVFDQFAVRRVGVASHTAGLRKRVFRISAGFPPGAGCW